jgi:hypothetical protein
MLTLVTLRISPIAAQAFPENSALIIFAAQARHGASRIGASGRLPVAKWKVAVTGEPPPAV